MHNTGNPFPLRPAEDEQATTEPSKIVQFLSEVAQERMVLGTDGFITCASDLTVRALAAAAAVGRFHGSEVDGVLTVLADTITTYTDTARTYLDPSSPRSRPDMRARASALHTAAEDLTEIVRAIEAEFQNVITVRATWYPSHAVEVFDYEEDPVGAYVPLDPPATAVDTIEDATRQLAERHFVVVGDWVKSTGMIGDDEIVEYHAALRFDLTF
ncbi:hypothetical protein DFR70_12647 [Nocardia tenerifensis]|uniref:Uncharacterized protein n=1 Tax=Nocardia tenerifensis TaxID=228006 RepID=A0A318JR95_9NOCA|nr:hypothetical protein [Nocardia tenerifensis]PXX53926.1 hypothetical protein DFR70_12647 [Nocardia tenerifensis]